MIRLINTIKKIKKVILHILDHQDGLNNFILLVDRRGSRNTKRIKDLEARISELEKSLDELRRVGIRRTINFGFRFNCIDEGLKFINEELCRINEVVGND